MKKSLCLLLCVCLILILMPTLMCPASAAYFSDVSRANSDTAEFFNAIMWIADNGYMAGTATNTFSPNMNMDRAMFVTILYAYSGQPSVSGYTIPFTDVPSNSYYYNAVLWAYNNGITAGTGNNLFGPTVEITFDQSATMLRGYSQNYMNYTLYSQTPSPSIPGLNQMPKYARPSIRWAYENGLIELGTNAEANATKIASVVKRKEFALLINRLHTNVEGIIIAENHFSFYNTTGLTPNSPQSPHFRSSLYSRTLISSLHYNRVLNNFDSFDQSRIYNAFFNNTGWKGACHGMCLCVIADMTGLCNFDEMYTQEESSMYEIPSPASCYSYPNIITSDRLGTSISWSESAIHYFHVLQAGYSPTYGGNYEPNSSLSESNVYNDYGGQIKGSGTELQSKVDAFYEKAKFCGIMLLNLSMNNYSGEITHSVVLIGPPDKSETGYIRYKIYDPQITYGTGNNMQNTLSTLRIPTTITSMNSITLSSASGYSITEIKYISDLSLFNQYDIDGQYNNTP